VNEPRPLEARLEVVLGDGSGVCSPSPVLGPAIAAGRVGEGISSAACTGRAGGDTGGWTRGAPITIIASKATVTVGHGAASAARAGGLGGGSTAAARAAGPVPCVDTAPRADISVGIRVVCICTRLPENLCA
jgi:hypothetical protein